LQDSIPVTMIDRKWMRAAHAWRIFLLLPSADLAASLSGMIDSQCSIHLKGESASLLIDPAYIVDVPSKGNKFLLVVETCYETQKDLGPDITALHQQSVGLQIGKPGAEPVSGKKPTLAPMSDEKKLLLMGLHRLFTLPKFGEFVRQLCEKKGLPVRVSDDKARKVAFKKLAGIESCKDLTEGAINSWRTAFNEWLKGGL
jgi:hypothetical protein